LINNFDNEKFNSRVVKLFLYYLIFIIFFGVTFSLVSYSVRGDGKLISDFYFVFLGVVIFSLGVTVVLGYIYKSMTLNTVGYRFSMILNIIFQLSISFSSSYIWILICMMIMEVFKRRGVFNGFFETHYTLSFLGMVFILMTITSGILFRFASIINTYFLDFCTSNSLVLSNAQIKKILSSIYSEKVYGIMVVFVTIMWLNNDNLSVENSNEFFSSVFNASFLVLTLSLSVYVNYVLTLFFKKWH